MPNISSSISSTSILDTVSTPAISRVTIAAANTEQSFALPANTKRFMIQNVGASLMKLAFANGTSGVTYFSIYPFTHYGEEKISTSASITLYFQTAKAGDIIEIVTWT